MSLRTFQILFYPWHVKKPHRATVDLMFKSDNVMRFKISANRKAVWMEKYRSTSPKVPAKWKVVGSNFKPQETSFHQVALFEVLANAINYELKKITDIPDLF